jgi:peptide/nickel transport system permease protein
MHQESPDLRGPKRWHFLARRLLHSATILLIISFLSFALIDVAPGEYVDEIRLDPNISQDTPDALRVRYGLDRPWVQRYTDWLGSVVQGDWGYSFAYGTPVAPLLWTRSLNTLALGLVSVVVSWLLAIPIGMSWALASKGIWDQIWAIVTSSLLSFPEVLWALLLLLFAVESRAFPAGGMWTFGSSEWSSEQKVVDLVHHMILPVSALVLSRIGVLIRHVKDSVEEARRLPHVHAARAKGLPKIRLLARHVLPLAANPLFTLFGLSIASLLSGSLIVEVVMGWPGLGPLLLEAILARDVYVVIGGVMCSAILLLLGSTATDLMLAVNDPRIALECADA